MAKKQEAAPEPEDYGSDDTIPSVIELDENLADVEAPPLLPRGRYRSTIQSVEEKTSAKGNTYYSQLLAIAPEEFPHDFPDDVYPDGLTLYYNMIVKPKTQRQKYALKQWLGKIGADVNTTRIDPSEWVGKEVMVTIAHGKYNDQPREEIKSVEATD